MLSFASLSLIGKCESVIMTGNRSDFNGKRKRYALKPSSSALSHSLNTLRSSKRRNAIAKLENQVVDTAIHENGQGIAHPTLMVEEESTKGVQQKAAQAGTDEKPTVYARLRIRPQIPDYSIDIEDSHCLPQPPSSNEAYETLEKLHSFYRGKLSTASHPKTKRRKDLLDSLIATILSQATSNTNSSRAFAALKGAFPTWEDAMHTGATEMEEHIRCGGLAKAKSRVIHTILRQLYDTQGKCSLDFLWDLDTEEAKRVLCRFHGVGPKTASCVLMFGMQRGEFPVDTHIRRIAARIGWMPINSSAEQTYQVLNSCVPDDIKHDLHVMLIEHGRKTCKARNPKCEECPLAKGCPSRLQLQSEAERQKQARKAF
ncbi:putative DNA glycosylase [Gracilariopsis chorda]|uniref:Putative DNA glycosylase n=1 Tax=Gracilariopsis chorda TaxID=448386 RepID=A0A2V3IK48_9FLOR|nr:putative DNA glycosylase [Gracilariopsis chorda]|eukprot:PXF42452.1 putative DNA glycosylase [Gracilariopsis chorda]